MNEKIICNECKCIKEKSKVYVKAKTLPRPRNVFYDEEGEKHIHDESVVHVFYTCSKGHTWEVMSWGHCINQKCGWNAEDFTTK